MIVSKYIDLRLNSDGRWVSLVQCCMVLPVYTTHATAEEALTYLETWAVRYYRYIGLNGWNW